MYANDFSIYRAVPIGVVIPRGPEDVIAGIEICRNHRAPVLPRGCGTAPSGQTTNVAVVFDYSKYYNQILELDPEAQRARVQPGRDLRPAQGRGRGPPPHLRTRPGHPRVLHVRRDARQQLVRHPLADGRQDVATTSSSSTCCCTTARASPSAPPPTTSWARSSTTAGARARSTPSYEDLRDGVADRVRAEYPDIPRRVSGYNLDQLLPENGFHVARALVGSEGTCVNVLEATVRLVPSPQHRRIAAAQLPRRVPGRRPRAGPPPDQPDRPRGLRRPADQEHDRQAPPRRRARRSCRTAAPGSTPSSATTTPTRPPRWPRRALEAVSGGPQLEARLIIDKAEQVSAWKVRESAVGDSRAPGYMDAEGNWEDAAVHPDKLGAYLRDFQQILDDHGYRCVYYGHFGQGCVHTRMDFDLKSRRRGQDVPVVHGEVRRPGGVLRRLAGRRVRRGPRPGRAAAQDVRPRADGRVQRLQADLGPRPQDEPQPADRRRQARRGPPARSRLPPAAAEHPFRVPRRRRVVRHRDRALLRDGQVPEPRQPDHVPELPRHPRGAPFDPRPRPAAVRDAQGRPDHRAAGATRRSRSRSTCACRARAAPAIARSRSTSRPTRRSSCPTTTPGAGAR